MVTIRTAELFDIPDLVDLGRAMFYESRYRRFSYVPAKYAAVLRNVIPQGLTFVAEAGGTVVGAFVGRIDRHFFGDAVMAYDVLTYVVPAHRGQIGVRLIREYIRRAKALGAVDIHIGHSVGVETDRADALYQGLGFTRIGGGYAMEV